MRVGFFIFTPFFPTQTIALAIHAAVWSAHSLCHMLWAVARMQGWVSVYQVQQLITDSQAGETTPMLPRMLLLFEAAKLYHHYSESGAKTQLIHKYINKQVWIKKCIIFLWHGTTYFNNALANVPRHANNLWCITSCACHYVRDCITVSHCIYICKWESQRRWLER